MLRSTDHFHTTFALTCQLLDRLLDDARLRLEAAGLTITERSNRTGFDHWSGYPYAHWEVHFRRELEHGSEIAAASARLSFFEPLDDTVQRELTATSIAEIYQTGKQSRVDDRSEQRIAISEMENGNVGTLVEQLIGRAYARLIDYGVVIDGIGLPAKAAR